MRITTWNVNGLRAAIKKGFAEVIDRLKPDVLLLQETRVRPEQLPDEWANPDGWHTAWNPATKPGYSGTAIWSREPLDHVCTGMGPLRGCAPDDEGRILRAETAGMHVVSIYLPNGSASEDRHKGKLVWMDEFHAWCGDYSCAKESVILGGDFNIAHTERDIFHAKSNEKQSGFRPEERAWIGQFFESGWHDLIRRQYGEIHGPYTWWSNRGRARELDRGWRIDYLLANACCLPRVKRISIDREAALQTSDHAPVTLELD
jgi:exodeoxyribonuclease-3